MGKCLPCVAGKHFSPTLTLNTPSHSISISHCFVDYKSNSFFFRAMSTPHNCSSWECICCMLVCNLGNFLSFSSIRGLSIQICRSTWSSFFAQGNFLANVNIKPLFFVVNKPFVYMLMFSKLLLHFRNSSQ